MDTVLKQKNVGQGKENGEVPGFPNIVSNPSSSQLNLSFVPELWSLARIIADSIYLTPKKGCMNVNEARIVCVKTTLLCAYPCGEMA